MSRRDNALHQSRFFLSVPWQGCCRSLRAWRLRLLRLLVFNHLPANHASQKHPEEAVYFYIQPAVAKEIDHEYAGHQQGKAQCERTEKGIPGAVVKLDTLTCCFT